MLCVDQGPHMNFGTRGTFKSVQAARAAALLGWAANGLHDRVGGILFGNQDQGQSYVRPTKDRRALWRLLKALTDTATETDESKSNSPDLLADTLTKANRGVGTGGLIFVIADFNQPQLDLKKSLSQLYQHHSVVLMPVDDPADRDLPDMGQAIFRDAEGQLVTVNTSDAAGRNAYREQWQQRRRELMKIANALGIAVIPLLTNEDVHSSLMHGLERRLRMRAHL